MKNKRKVKPGASAAWRKSWAECDKTYHWEIKMNSLRIAAELHTFSNSAWPTCPARVKTLTSLWMSPCNSLRGAVCGKNQQCKPMREGKMPWHFSHGLSESTSLSSHPKAKIIIRLALFGSSNSAFALCLLNRQDRDSQNVKTDYISYCSCLWTCQEQLEKVMKGLQAVTWRSVQPDHRCLPVQVSTLQTLIFPISLELSTGFSTIPLSGGLGHEKCTRQSPANWEA